MDTCTSGTQRRGDRAIGSYDYISCGETSEKVGYSIGPAWVGAVAAFDERGHGEVRGEVQGGVFWFPAVAGPRRVMVRSARKTE